jgi:phosphoribosylaminoimidazole-succinocarboxamide synthase
VVLPDPIPGKGEVLTQISNFWFARTEHIIRNHLLDVPLSSVLPGGEDIEILARRSVVTRRLEALPIEAVARGYLIGSGWKDYRATGGVCGIPLPEGLNLADRLPEPIFTPATKAESGEHDENISFERVEQLIGHDLATRVREVTLRLYSDAADYARSRGIIIADTKFEFGLDEDGQLYLIDEILTPDSSRFWPARSYRPGISPPSFDKQFVRDYLETLDWDKRAPGPPLPAEIIQRTSEKYMEALRLLTGAPAP